MSVEKYMEDIAIRAAADTRRFFAEQKEDWYRNNRAAQNPEDTCGALNKGTAEACELGWNVFTTVVGYLALRVDPTAIPEVKTETLGRVVKIIVAVRDTWVGTVTWYSTGGEEACASGDTLTSGFTLELNPKLANRWLCFDAAHVAQREAAEKVGAS